MLRRRLQEGCRDERGITGLETAIILIAFIMVAAVFAYVVLSAGLFSSQEARQAIYSGIERTKGTIEVRGSVLANMTDGVVDQLLFCVGSIGAASEIDFTDTSEGNNTVVISYYDQYNQYPSVNWTLNKIMSSNEDNILDENELFQIIVDLAPINAAASTPDERLSAYHTFTLEVKPPIGAILSIERTIPARVSQLVNLH